MCLDARSKRTFEYVHKHPLQYTSLNQSNSDIYISVIYPVLMNQPLPIVILYK